MVEELIIRPAELDDINLIGYMAQQVWPVAYQEILQPEQLQYMLNLFYSPGSLKQQMTTNHHQFLIAEHGSEPVGFASFSQLEDPDIYKLHKLYVLPGLHNKGIGKALLESVVDSVNAIEGKKLQLNVNRNNKARHFYEKHGFTIIGEEDIDIGNGYYMNDFVMERIIA